MNVGAFILFRLEFCHLSILEKGADRFKRDIRKRDNRIIAFLYILKGYDGDGYQISGN